MTTKKLLIAICLLMTSCNNIGHPIKIYFQFVDLEIFTPINVDCDKFEEYFNDDIKIIEIKDSKVEIFNGQLSSFLKRAKLFNDLPDTRIKVTIYYKNKHDFLCISNNLVSFDNKVYVMDDIFRNFLVEFLFTASNGK